MRRVRLVFPRPPVSISETRNATGVPSFSMFKVHKPVVNIARHVIESVIGLFKLNEQ